MPGAEMGNECPARPGRSHLHGWRSLGSGKIRRSAAGPGAGERRPWNMVQCPRTVPVWRPPMTARRVRLSVESLEDRTTPATVADLHAAAAQTYATAGYLNQLNGNRWLITSPAIRPAVQSFFTNVFRQATRTAALLAEFPGALPPGQANLIRWQANTEATIARWVGSALGFSVTAAPTIPPVPTPGPASPAQSTVAVSPASIQ